MAIINSYPLIAPKSSDLILGTSANSNGRTKTVSFTVQSIQSLSGGVTSVASGNVNTIVIGGTAQQPTVGTVTAAVGLASNYLATGAQIATYVTTNYPGTVSGTGTFNTLSKWSANGIDIEDSALLDDTSGETITITNRQVWPAITNSKDLGGTANRWKNLWATQSLYAENVILTGTNTYISLSGSTGTAGQVLTSGGDGVSATWADNASGTGTTNKLSKWTNATTLTDSNVEDTGTLVTISSATKITGNLELDADLLDINGSTGTAGQLLSSLGTGNGVDWINAPVTGIITVTAGTDISVTGTASDPIINNTAPDQTVAITGTGGTVVTGTYPNFTVNSDDLTGYVQSVTSANTDVITIGGSSANPTVTANITAGVGTGLANLATGGQIQAAIDTAVSSSLTYRGGYNASTNTPDLTTSPNSILTGDTYAVTVAGNASGFWSPTLSIGDLLIANIDNPSTIVDWTEVQSNIDVATDTVQGIANFPTSGGLTVTTGAVSIANTTVTPGVYTNTNLTVDAQGRITTATSGSAGSITGSGTTNIVPLWTSATALGDSAIAQSGTNIGIGTTSPSALLDVNADAKINGLTVGRGTGNVSSNTAVGSSALVSNTTGMFNTANGYNALRLNTTGDNNTANGYEALYNNTIGINNAANGNSTLYSNTTGGQNTASGVQALYNNTTGVNNTANGFQALNNNTTGIDNTANGSYALNNNTTGGQNTASGKNALLNNTGSNNTAKGYQTLQDNTTGNFNVAIGVNAGSSLTTGSNNTIIGSITGAVGLSDTVIIGAGATERLRISSTGQVKFNSYTSAGAFTGTAVADLAVDSSGNIITKAAGSGLPTITVDTGSGTGAQTAYTLSVTPSSVNYVNVFINGVYQAKSSYAVSGVTLTFTTAPPNNSVIEFVTTT